MFFFKTNNLRKKVIIHRKFEENRSYFAHFFSFVFPQSLSYWAYLNLPLINKCRHIEIITWQQNLMNHLY